MSEIGEAEVGGGCAGELAKSWTASKFPLPEEARVLLTFASLSQTIMHAWYFSKTTLDVRRKGEKTFLGRTQETSK